MDTKSVRCFLLLGFTSVLLPILATSPAAMDMPTGTGNVEQNVESPTAYRETRYESGNRRDPFRNPLFPKKKPVSEDEEERGQPPPGIAGMYIANVTLLGISIGSDGKTAVFQGSDKRAYFLQEGDRFFDGYLRAIGIDWVTLVRETRLRSGKSVTQEVIKRLRTP